MDNNIDKYNDKIIEYYNGKQPFYYIITFGCQQNEADSEHVETILRSLHFLKTDKPQNADIILVNTCAVREHAELKELSKIGEFKKIKDQNPNMILCVFGCMVAQDVRIEQIKNSFKYVDFTFNSNSINQLSSMIYDSIYKKNRFFKLDYDNDIDYDYHLNKVSFKSWLSIMTGCNNFCTYCIVPYVRGREKSRSSETILKEAEYLISNGAKDITLLGQNVNSYGKDNDNCMDFADLISSICKIDGEFKLRFMTSHPKDVSDKLINVIAEEKKVVKHFHLPVQSGSDHILKKMNRVYDVDHYLKIVDKIRAYIPDICLSTDIIVSFPGETEDDFQNTLDLINYVKYDAIFSFIYSPRKGTPAASMTDMVSPSVSKERFARLLDLSNSISLEQNRRFIGQTKTILVESESKNDKSMLTGRFDSPRPVHIKADKSMIGKFANVKIVDADTFALYGIII